ncbi:MAG: phosphatase PAP2 family protein [Patescibacteria group bacterium]
MINPRFLFLGLGLSAIAIIYLIIWALMKSGPKAYRFIKSLAFSLWPALRQNEYIAEFIYQQPRLNHFIKKRSSRQSFVGLPLTILGLAFLYVLFAFLGLVEDFITSDQIVAIDSRLNNFLLLFRSEHYVKIFLAITTLGRARVIISLLLAASLLFWLWRKRAYILPAWLSLGGASLLNFLSKWAFHRPRPAFPVYIESNFSFPSGHATVAVAAYGFLTYCLLRNTKKLPNRALVFLAGLLIIAAIGFSRLYLGVHYLSDVLAGYLLGALWLTMGISLTEWQLDRQKRQETEAAPN